jgi:hypothetical protein
MILIPFPLKNVYLTATSFPPDLYSIKSNVCTDSSYDSVTIELMGGGVDVCACGHLPPHR